MERKAALERSIRESSDLIREYEAIVRTSDRPEEKQRARRVIGAQWALVQGYLAEYRPLVDGCLPEDIAQVAARFASLDELTKVDQAIEAQEQLRSVWPNEQIEPLLAPLRDKRQSIHAQLWGSGSIVQGGGVAAGAGGVAVGGNVGGDVITGGKKEVHYHGPAGPDPANLRTAYLKRLARECGLVRLLGLDTAAGHAEGDREADVYLEAVYVHLGTTRSAAAEPPKSKRARRAESAAMEEPRVLTALEAAARFPRLALIGGPGSGKSTFASYLALCLAVHAMPVKERPFALDVPRHLPGWPADRWPLPVRVTLREFARELARELPSGLERGDAGLLWRHIERHLAPLGEFKDALKEALLSGHALVVLDGLDEVPERAAEGQASPRRLALQAVEDFALNAFPQARCLVTCRVASYVSPWTLSGFEVAPLAEFDRDRQDTFCRLWYVELARRGQLEADKVDGKVSGLQKAIRRADLERMAGNPLLLTVMALVHARDAELPEARALLYDRCTDVLLWLWERRKVEAGRPSDLLTLLQEGGVDRTFFVRALHRLAYDIHQEGGARVGETDIRASLLERRLEVLHPQRDPRWARQVATFIRERAGLLVERQADEVDPLLAFPHRTFQEYLAARWLIEGEDMARQAAALARQGDHWWEVIKLAAGQLLYVEHKVSQPLALLDWLCPEAAPSDPGCWRLARLAGDTLLELKPEQMLRDETARPQVAGRLERVRRRLAALLQGGHLEARERAMAGSTLAQLGDGRFRADAWFLPAEPLLGFVQVPAGPFRMGSDEKRDPQAFDDEMPPHTVDLARYYIARYPVTQAQYRAFVQDTGHKPPTVDPDYAEFERPYEWPEGRPPAHLLNHPVVLVTWYDALAYCGWLTERLRGWAGTPEPLAALLREGGWQVCLPSEAQWEKAARGGLPSPGDVPIAGRGAGGEGRIYPWGDEPDPNRANYADTGIGSTSAVGCFPAGASPYGCLDMSGNVWEWTASLWGKDVGEPDFKYPYDPGDGRENLEAGDAVLRVLRGGSFLSARGYARCTARYGSRPLDDWHNLGFRVVFSPIAVP